MTGSPPRSAAITDPMERLIAEALDKAGIAWLHENDPGNAARLDFYLPDHDLYIEVKRLASERSGDQLKRADNVVLVQGKAAVEWLVEMLARR